MGVKAITITSNRRDWILQSAGILAVIIALATAAHANWIYTKALLAQWLLDHAWEESLQYATPQKPWSWADVRTSARLFIADQQTPLVILSDASGEAMAFGPGLVAGNPLRANSQTIAIGGHRDTHLAFLEHLPIGASIHLENTRGESFQYRLIDKQVVDSSQQSLKISNQKPGLVLITCFPFNATQTGGSLRMVARALPY